MGIDFQTEWEAFKALPIKERQGVFKRLYGHSGAHLQATLLEELVKARLQEIHFGALSPEEETQLDAICTNGGKVVMLSQRRSVIYREYKGRRYEVIQLENGCFRYNAKDYRSLSSVARAITGQRINGPRFFHFPKTRDAND